MRIISGKAKGIPLDTLEGKKTRPTIDRVKEALFSSIHFDIPRSKVLDLFAGSGALGLEAASRGAESVVLVEKNLDCEKYIRKNIDKSGLTNIEIYMGDSFNFLNTRKEKFDIIFLDPPYSQKLDSKAIELILKNALINPEGLIIVEKLKKDNIEYDDNKLSLLKEKNYGNTDILILMKK